MLKKANRLAKARDIKLALARGRSFFNSIYSIKFLPTPDRLRFTVVVSTKVFKQAVRRNRIKRLLREYVRHHLAEFRRGDYFISVKSKSALLPEPEQLRAFEQVIQKIR